VECEQLSSVGYVCKRVKKNDMICLYIRKNFIKMVFCSASRTEKSKKIIRRNQEEEEGIKCWKLP